MANGWLARLQADSSFDDVLAGPDGVAAWLWSRWRSLGAGGFTEDDLVEVVRGYGREIWLWLAGERTWAHCCSGLIGRVNRRQDQHEPAGA